MTADLGSRRLREDATSATNSMAVGFAFGLMLVAALLLVLVGARRRADAVRRAETERLASVALKDSLTGLRNYRAFQEDIARDLSEATAAGSPLTLILLDVDGLKGSTTVTFGPAHLDGSYAQRTPPMPWPLDELAGWYAVLALEILQNPEA